jgi:thioredoxin 1
MTMSVLNVTVETFEAEVLKNPKPVLVDFWAPWCGPCKMVGPILEEIAADRDDIVVAKVNVDDNMALAKQYRIISIPTMMLMKNGEIAKKLVGFHEREEIEEIL